MLSARVVFFFATLASTAITAMQYHILATARRFSSYETIGGLFREVTRNSAELTITERIWGIIIDIVSEIAQCFEIEDEKIFETLLINRSDKLQHFIQIYESAVGAQSKLRCALGGVILVVFPDQYAPYGTKKSGLNSIHYLEVVRNTLCQRYVKPMRMCMSIHIYSLTHSLKFLTFQDSPE